MIASGRLPLFCRLPSGKLATAYEYLVPNCYAFRLVCSVYNLVRIKSKLYRTIGKNSYFAQCRQCHFVWMQSMDRLHPEPVILVFIPKLSRRTWIAYLTHHPNALKICVPVISLVLQLQSSNTAIRSIKILFPLKCTNFLLRNAQDRRVGVLQKCFSWKKNNSFSS